MHRQHFSHDPRVGGMAYGFYEMRQDHPRVIGHTGATNDFRTLLALLPEQNTGLFASYNSASAGPALDELLDLFLDHYYPASSGLPSTPPSNSSQASDSAAGHYRASNSAYTTFEKLFSEIIGVAATEDGSVVIRQIGYEGNPYMEIQPLVFREIDGRNTLVFRKDDQGEIIYMFSSSLPHRAFIKVQWYEAPPFHLSLLVLSVTTFVLVLWQPINTFRRRGARKKRPISSLPRPVGWIFRAASGLNLLFLILLLIIAVNVQEIEFGIPVIVYVALAIALVSTALVTAIIAATMLTWRNNYGDLRERIHYTLVTVVAISFAWQLSHFNLLGFRF
jgi:uncharacterized integral membrane protein